MKLIPVRRHSRSDNATRPVSGAARFARGATLVGAAIALGLIGTGTSYAFLNSSASAATSALVTAGTAEISVSTEPTSFSNVYPGSSQSQSFSIKNVGDVSLILSGVISGATAANGLVVGVAPGNCLVIAPPAAGFTGTTLAPAASSEFCLTVSMPMDAPASAIGSAAQIAVTVTGTQS